MNERMYHVVVIRETHGSAVFPKGHKTYMTAAPLRHSQACVLLSGITDYKWRRKQLEEVA